MFRLGDNWRGAKELQLDTSNETAKYYDAAVTQFLGWYDDERLGGLSGCLSRLRNADQEFVLGRALILELEMLGGINSAQLDPDLAVHVRQLNNLADRKRGHGQLSERDALHVQVVNAWADNKPAKARQYLEKLATVCPWDMAALKMNQDNSFGLGALGPMRLCLSSAIQHFKTNSGAPNRALDLGYLLGMYSFALEESNEYEKAREVASQALQLNPLDTWAVHSYAHTLEMEGKCAEGFEWMSNRKSDWSRCKTLARHQNWHTALFLIQMNRPEEALELIDSEGIAKCGFSESSLNLHDAASILYRIELVDLFQYSESHRQKRGGGIDKRWQNIYSLCLARKYDHLLGFNDAHYMMSYLGVGDLETAREFIEGARAQESPVYREVVVPLLEAMLAFKLGEYASCTELLGAIRHDIIRIGGSHAQRDVFEQLLTVAAGRCQEEGAQKLHSRMMLERNLRVGEDNFQSEVLARASVDKK